MKDYTTKQQRLTPTNRQHFLTYKSRQWELEKFAVLASIELLILAVIFTLL